MSADLYFKYEDKDGQIHNIFSVSRISSLSELFMQSEYINVGYNKNTVITEDSLNKLSLELEENISRVKDMLFLSFIKQQISFEDTKDLFEEYNNLVSLRGKLQVIYEILFCYDKLIAYYV